MARNPVHNWINRFTRRVQNGAQRNRRRILNEAAVLHLEYLHKRFENNAKGGGNWPPITLLAQKSKIRAAKGRRRILQDTLTLHRALKPTKNKLPYGQRRLIDVNKGTYFIDYTHMASHPRLSNTGRIRTVKQVANFHERAMGNNPLRVIFVPPDTRTARRQGLKGALIMVKMIIREIKRG